MSTSKPTNGFIRTSHNWTMSNGEQLNPNPHIYYWVPLLIVFVIAVVTIPVVISVLKRWRKGRLEKANRLQLRQEAKKKRIGERRRHFRFGNVFSRKSSKRDSKTDIEDAKKSRIKRSVRTERAQKNLAKYAAALGEVPRETTDSVSEVDSSGDLQFSQGKSPSGDLQTPPQNKSIATGINPKL